MCSREFFGIDVGDCGSSSIEELVDDGTEKSIWTGSKGRGAKTGSTSQKLNFIT